jgi:hypothetical protein
MSRTIVVARPQLALQCLDDRLCPSVSVAVLDGHILRVLGDDAADQLAIVDQGGGSVVMYIPDHQHFEYRGIDTILVRSGAGDDVVTFARHLPGQSAGGRAVNLIADLGSGDDTFRLTDPGAAGASPNRPLVRVDGGDGRDDVTDIFSGQGGGSGRLFEPNDDVEVNLGRGDDTFTLLLPTSMDAGAASGQQSPLSVEVNGDAGDDTFRTIASRVLIDDPNLLPAVRTRLDVGYDGGPGDDTFDTELVGIAMDAPAQFRMDGGTGRDTFVTSFRGVAVNAPTDLVQSGGGGNDDIRVISGFNPQPDPPARPGLAVNAPLRIDLSGGGGNDDIRVISGFNPQPDPPAVPVLTLNSRLTVRLDGGAGDDVLFADIIPCIRPAGSLAMSSDGGAGDDVVVAAIYVDAMSEPNPAVICRVNGGEGNDLLALVAVDPFETNTRADFRIDGGAGIDTVLVATPNVRIRNCEL